MKEIDKIIKFLSKKDPQNAEKRTIDIMKNHVERIKKYFTF